MATIQERLAIIETEIKSSNALNRELIDILKSEHGLITRMALIEQHPKTCPIQTTVKWHTKVIYSLCSVPVVAYIIKLVLTEN